MSYAGAGCESTLADVSLKAERRPLAALTDIVEPWRALCERAAEPNVFYDPAFALAAAPIFGHGVEAILIWDAAERLVGFFPFSVAARRYGIRVPLILGWTHHFAPLGTPLVDRDFSCEAIAAFLARIARDDALPKLLLLPLLNESGPVAAALQPVPSGAPHLIAINARSSRRRANAARYLEAPSAPSGARNFAGSATNSPTAARSTSVAREPNEIAAALKDFLRP